MSLCLELFKVIDHQTAEERATIVQTKSAYLQPASESIVALRLKVLVAKYSSILSSLERQLAVVHHVYTLWVYVNGRYFVGLRLQYGDAHAHIIWDEIPLLSFGKSSYIFTRWYGFASVGYSRRST